VNTCHLVAKHEAQTLAPLRGYSAGNEGIKEGYWQQPGLEP